MAWIAYHFWKHSIGIGALVLSGASHGGLGGQPINMRMPVSVGRALETHAPQADGYSIVPLLEQL